MKINGINIEFLKKDGFYSIPNEGVTHVKVLPYLSVVQSLEGHYDIALGNSEKCKTTDGGFFIAPAGVRQTITHHVNEKSGKMSCRWIFVDARINREFSPDSLYTFPTVINGDERHELNSIFERIFKTDDAFENYADCCRLLGYLTKLGEEARESSHGGLKTALSYISEHYAERITVKTLADSSNMSESNFYALFKKLVGTSPIAYLNNYRLSAAANALSQSTRSIKEIAFSVGIDDSMYFSKLFRKTYGMSPSEYRTLYKSRT